MDKEKLLKEFEAAINATFGDKEEFEVSNGDIDEIARKVKFYLED